MSNANWRMKGYRSNGRHEHCGVECADFLEKVAFGDFEGAMGWKVIGPQDGPLILARVTAGRGYAGLQGYKERGMTDNGELATVDANEKRPDGRRGPYARRAGQ